MELTTKVTSIAEEEKLTGTKIEMPGEEELANRAMSSFIRNRKAFVEYFDKLSGRGKVRVMNAVLDLPADGVPVYLKDDAEKLAFAIGQRTIADRFIITQHHIVQEVKKSKAEQAEKKKEELDKAFKELVETTEEQKLYETLD
jgi:hypothetical protein